MRATSIAAAAALLALAALRALAACSSTPPPAPTPTPTPTPTPDPGTDTATPPLPPPNSLAPPPPCVDLHPRVPDEDRAALGLQRLLHQPTATPLAAIPKQRPKHLIVAPAGVQTALPMPADPDEPDPESTLSLVWDVAIVPDQDGAGDLFEIGALNKKRAITPRPEALGSIIRLAGGDTWMTIAIGEQALALWDLYQRVYLPARQAPPQFPNDELEPIALFTHDLDRDGTPELIIRAVAHSKDDADGFSGELGIVWPATGRVATGFHVLEEGSTFLPFETVPAWDQRGLLLVATTLCCDATTVRWFTLGDTFSEIEDALANGVDTRVCATPAPEGHFAVRIEAR